MTSVFCLPFSSPRALREDEPRLPAVSLSNPSNPPAVSLSNPPAVSLPAVSLSNPSNLPATRYSLLTTSSAPALNLSNAPALSKRSASNGFTLIEVMMAATILVVGFIGMIQAVSLSSGMMDHARRQSLAAQILSHEIEQLRLQSWTAINTLPTSSTALGAAYNAGTTYYVGDTVTSSGAWYRCTQQGSGQTPSSGSSYWKVDTPPYANSLSTSGVALGATYTLARTAANLTTDANGNVNLREVTFTVTWVVTTSRLDSSNKRLTFTYSRVSTSWFGKYGLNLTYQRS